MQPIMQPIPFTNQDPGVFIRTLSYLTIPSVGACRLVCSHWKQLLETKYQDGKLFVWQVVALSQLPSIDLNKIPDFPSYLRIHANLIDGVCFQRCLKDAGAPMILKGGVLFSAGAEDPRRQVNTARQVLKWDWRNGACLGAMRGIKIGLCQLPSPKIQNISSLGIAEVRLRNGTQKSTLVLQPVKKIHSTAVNKRL